jgi:hypothetical protein
MTTIDDLLFNLTNKLFNREWIVEDVYPSMVEKALRPILETALPGALTGRKKHYKHTDNGPLCNQSDAGSLRRELEKRTEKLVASKGLNPVEAHGRAWSETIALSAEEPGILLTSNIEHVTCRRCRLMLYKRGRIKTAQL